MGNQNEQVSTGEAAPQLASDAIEKCTKKDCEEPRSGNKPWCKTHLAEYQRNYMKTKEGQAGGRGFALGVRLMREQLAEQFGFQKSGQFSGYEIHDLILEAPSPDFDAVD